MDHASSHSSSAPATTYYQPVPYRETQGHEEEESQQANLDPITSEPDTSENENGDPQGSEMPRMERHGLDLATILGDVAAVASPVALIVFAVMVLCIDGLEASETSYAKWNNATTVLGTLFPIIFASTVGRFVYEVARWKLEQGVTLGTLEQLLGSQAVGSAVLTHAKLCVMNPLGAGLLFIWIFSPLGGQSLLRILGSRLEPVVKNSTIIHFDSDAASIFSQLRTIGGPEFGIIDDDIGYLGNWYNPFQVSNLVQAYTISKPWITLCFVSCIVLLCSGVLSVVFAHLADSPEILGYASTAVRDSKFLELWPEVGGMAAIDITKMMRGERLRYGITHLTRKGQRLLGVGREAETEEIKDRFV